MSRSPAACHGHPGGGTPTKHVAVHPPVRGYAVSSDGSVSCPGLPLGLQSLWGWRVRGDATAPSKINSIHVTILHPAASPQGMLCGDVVQAGRILRAPAFPFLSLWWPQGLLEMSECQQILLEPSLLPLSPGPTHGQELGRAGAGADPVPRRTWAELMVAPAVTYRCSAEEPLPQHGMTNSQLVSPPRRAGPLPAVRASAQEGIASSPVPAPPLKPPAPAPELSPGCKPILPVPVSAALHWRWGSASMEGPYSGKTSRDMGHGGWSRCICPGDPLQGAGAQPAPARGSRSRTLRPAPSTGLPTSPAPTGTEPLP